MKVIGYSERGIVNSLLYAIAYSSQPESLLEELLSLVTFPYVCNQPIHVCSAGMLIEQSFSDFGGNDALLLVHTGKQNISIFLEAKVRAFQKWAIADQFDRFCNGFESVVKSWSSNLFTQLYYKERMVNAIRERGVKAVKEGIRISSKSSKKTTRKIGNNQVVLEAVQRLVHHLDATFYVALIPDPPERAAAFFARGLTNAAPRECPDRDVSHYGYICWPQIEAFCSRHGLRGPLDVFGFNGEQIY